MRPTSEPETEGSAGSPVGPTSKSALQGSAGVSRWSDFQVGHCRVRLGSRSGRGDMSDLEVGPTGSRTYGEALRSTYMAQNRNEPTVPQSEDLTSLLRSNLEGAPVGLYSVCSAHPLVLKAAFRQALEDHSLLLIESTSNQVNQFGGYTGMTPDSFAKFVTGIATSVGLPPGRLILGGDHLGPHCWRSEAADAAMAKARDLVREYVAAGFRKIHIDTSMACADDLAGQAGLDERIKTDRASELCLVAEQAWRELPPGSARPVYVIGTEVPVPGGERADSGAPEVTTVEEAEATLGLYRSVFQGRGLTAAWDRVIGLVVQPGVEFGDAVIFPYCREKTRGLSRFIETFGTCVFEAHSTDYQAPEGLRELVEDHFAILKVGPWLTFALREAVFGLASIEQEWLGGRPGIRLSEVREVLEQEMLDHPEEWEGYYRGDEHYLRYARRYSYSDRCRYYWARPAVAAAFQALLENLATQPIPLPLLSQFLPPEYQAVRESRIQPKPEELIDHRVRSVLQLYSNACGMRGRSIGGGSVGRRDS